MAGLTLLLLICYRTSLVSPDLLPPENLNFDSKNFQHILTWDDPNNESLIYYKVGYKEANEMKVSKSCSNITSRRCDLTKDLTDIMSKYTVWVHSFTDHNVSNKATKDFWPIEQTVLGPVLVNVVPSNHSIEVFIDPPISHLWDEKEQRNVTMVSDAVFPLMEYTIHYGQPGKSLQSIPQQSTRNSTVILQLLPNTNYCVSVDVKPSGMDVPSIPSAHKCVITGPQGSRLDVILPVVFGVLSFFGILLTLLALDRAGYICKQRSLIPKVLKSFSQSESIHSGRDDCTSPTCVVPVEIVSQKLEVKESQETEVRFQDGGYACRKKLLDSDTSAGDSSGPVISTNSLCLESSGQMAISLESSGQMTISSVEERISSNHQIDITDSSGSFSQIPASAVESSLDLPVSNCTVFNINLNSICIGSSVDTSTGHKIGAPTKEEPMEKSVRHSGEAEPLPNMDIIGYTSKLLVDLNPTGTDYGSDNYEEDLSDNDSDCVGSGYMRR